MIESLVLNCPKSFGFELMFIFIENDKIKQSMHQEIGRCIKMSFVESFLL